MVEVREVLEFKAADVAEQNHKEKISHDHQGHHALSYTREVVRAGYNQQVRDEAANAIGKVTHGPEPNIFAIRLHAVVRLDKNNNAEDIDKEAMEKCIDNVLGEDANAKTRVVHPQFVKKRV